MSDDLSDTFKCIKEEHRIAKEMFGYPCPKCVMERPNESATIMMPQRRCKRHKRAYQDYRTWKQIAMNLKRQMDAESEEQ